MSQEEQQALAEYYEQMRRQHAEAEAAQKGRAMSGASFKTPEVIDFEQYWDYGNEAGTASAHYRPRNSNTALRLPRNKIISGKPYSSNRKDTEVSDQANNLKATKDAAKAKRFATEKSSPSKSDNTPGVNHMNG